MTSQKMIRSIIKREKTSICDHIKLTFFDDHRANIAGVHGVNSCERANELMPRLSPQIFQNSDVAMIDIDYLFDSFDESFR